MDEATVKRIKEQYDDTLFSVGPVHSTSVAFVDGEIGIRVYIEDDSVIDQIPSTIEGVPVEIIVRDRETPDAGTHSVSEPQADGQTNRFRPIQPGVSGNHADGTACTLNFVYTDGDSYYIGGNNHCFARSNQANIGDDVLQPSPNDGGGGGDVIGQLTNYVILQDTVAADFAWAEIDTDWVADCFEFNPLFEPQDPSLGDPVVASTRTSGTLEGGYQVTETGVRVRVDYGDPLGTITVYDCFRSDLPTNGGDSGSPVLRPQNGGYVPMGIHFAGNDNHASHCKISNVEEITGLSVVTEGGSLSRDDETPTCVRNVV